ncbi:DUF4890 domain-containing protein [Bacteroides sp. 214]|uniref:DUF4890 domain-containing protein n=1 Tax=Bacteroides sp. 214 TaxID=2302935 RepID=UPI0013D7F3AB|nr:DUF4890 domain-containing protein [Bacteroides sp. 214]NDW11418.1 DUF4890 domain-containing protein [Bacteroides sp. 214]
MKKFGFLMAVLLVAGNLMAQQRPGRNMDPKERAKTTTEQMVKSYSLDADQQEKVYALNLEMAEGMSKITSENRDERRAQMQKVQENYTKKLKEVLTAEQYEKYAKDAEERRQRRGGNRSRN